MSDSEVFECINPRCKTLCPEPCPMCDATCLDCCPFGGLCRLCGGHPEGTDYDVCIDCDPEWESRGAPPGWENGATRADVEEEEEEEEEEEKHGRKRSSEEIETDN